MLAYQAISNIVVSMVVTPIPRQRCRAGGKDERNPDCECSKEQKQKPVSTAEGENPRGERSFLKLGDPTGFRTRLADVWSLHIDAPWVGTV
jgi:hypothetical protein